MTAESEGWVPETEVWSVELSVTSHTLTAYKSVAFPYPLTAGVVGAPEMTSQLFSTALWDLANSRPVHSLLCSCLLCLLPLFHCSLQDGFGQTWCTGDMSIPLQFASLYVCLLTASYLTQTGECLRGFFLNTSLSFGPLVWEGFVVIAGFWRPNKWSQNTNTNTTDFVIHKDDILCT